jgi:hypothetical protein
MIQIRQPTLKNFSVFQKINLFDNNVKITKSGIIHAKRVICPDCGQICHYNGSSNKGKHILSNSYNSFLRKGQQYCPECKKTIQVENEWLDEMIKNFNDYLATEIISLSTSMSEDEIRDHLYLTKSINLSKSQIHNVIYKTNKDLANLEFDFEIEEEFYGYDEQYITIDGQRAYRLVFYDLKNNKVIYEDTHKYFSKKILQNILRYVFKGKEPKGFVTDMRVEYPSAFKTVFGRKIKIQFCIFHLNKLILKEYQESLRIGKKCYWTITDYYNMYSLFNIFYDRSFELKKLKKLSFQLDNFKNKLTSEKIEFYAKKYNLDFKKEETLERKVVEIIQKKLIKSFRNICKSRRLNRKRNKLTLTPRTVNSAKYKFEEIEALSSIYPKRLQMRISRIKDNFEYFIASEGEILTNNKLEGFFGATLKKFRKKIKKSYLSFKAMLNFKRAKREGIETFRRFTLFDLTKIFTTLSFFA